MQENLKKYMENAGNPMVLLRNKLNKAGKPVLCNNKAKNAGITFAMTRLFNAVSVQKNKPEWSSYFAIMAMGTNVINNLTALKFFSIATAIQKNLCLASCSYHLFLERKELLEVPKTISSRKKTFVN